MKPTLLSDYWKENTWKSSWDLLILFVSKLFRCIIENNRIYLLRNLKTDFCKYSAQDKQKKEKKTLHFSPSASILISSEIEISKERNTKQQR